MSFFHKMHTFMPCRRSLVLLSVLLLLAASSSAFVVPDSHRSVASSSFSSSSHIVGAKTNTIEKEGATTTVRRFAVALPLPDMVVSPPSSSTKTTTTTNGQKQQQQLQGPDQWVAQLDYANFGREVAALGQDLQRESSGSAEVLEHLQKMMAWRNACAILGVCTLWTTPNPITIAALSTWTYASWVVVAHHTCHGGYNRVATTMDKSGSSSSNNNNPFHSRGFALGTVQQRCKDWLDWILPEAWNMEHNRLHHYRLNELNDPDLVQRNMENIRSGTMPMAAKYGVVGFFVLFWKWFYYAPNTFKELQINKWKQEGRELPGGFDPKGSVTVATLFGRGPEFQALRQVVPPTELFGKVLAPFFMGRFVLLPAPLLLVPGVGPTLFAHAVINLVAADILTNMHAFCTIVTNHAGEDLYTFDDAVKPKSPSFYVRQIVGSANFETDRTDVPDFLHGFLNYQIEHHVWPDLSTLQYQRAAPRLREICHRYGVPYVQESVWTRLAKTVDIMVGKTSMRPFPTQFEPAADKAVTSNKGWKTSHGDINEEEYQ